MYADIVVIGGGASGIAAAISAKKACPPAKIVIAERLDKVGRKILSTGNGRCNLSNQSILPEHYHGSVRNIMKIIEKTPSAEVRDLSNAFDRNAVAVTAAVKGKVSVQ